ncbi:hypothetical protein BLNAU_21753 [Blattamonas nauphoetae]|uniref:Uncharacterized protein n=1 Tax=Blattamonas nauphoetae TaxID=2049346 RepID=A0ABQ9WV08_9EUKA|nr:hypothetical protein BLNAU_21753 [Blattamonas nauphoetae]
MNQEETYERSEQQQHFRTIILSGWAYTNKTDTKKKTPVPVPRSTIIPRDASSAARERKKTEAPKSRFQQVKGCSAEKSREKRGHRDISDVLSASTNTRDHSKFGGWRELMGGRARCAVRGAEWQRGSLNSSLGTATI